MSTFKVNVVARNTKDQGLASQPIEALVDTRRELTWLPKDVLTGINVTPVHKYNVATAINQVGRPGSWQRVGIPSHEIMRPQRGHTW